MRIQTITIITKLKISTLDVVRVLRQCSPFENIQMSIGRRLFTSTKLYAVLLVCHWIELNRIEWNCHNLHHITPTRFGIHILNASRSLLYRLIFNVNNKMNEFHLFACKFYLSTVLFIQGTVTIDIASVDFDSDWDSNSDADADLNAAVTTSKCTVHSISVQLMPRKQSDHILLEPFEA